MVMMQERHTKLVIYENNLNGEDFSGTVDLKKKKAELGDSAFRETPARSERSEQVDYYVSPSSLPQAPNLHKHKESYVSERFIKFIPSQNTSWLRSTYPNAFLVLSVIAERARRVNDMPDGLVIGDAIISYEKIGEKCGLSKKQARLAIEKLVEHDILEIVWNGKGQKPVKKRALKRAIKGMLVNLCDSSIWDINPEGEGTVKGNQRAHRGHTEGTKQEGRRMNNNEKEDHPPYPLHPKKEERVDDDDSFFSKKEERIHVHREAYMTKDDLDHCIKARGGIEKVKLIIDQILDWDGRKYEINDWRKSILKWSITNNFGEIRESNEDYGRAIEKKYKNYPNSWSVRVFRCDIKDDFGLFFELTGGAVAKSEFFSFSDKRFKEKVDSFLLEKKFK